MLEVKVPGIRVGTAYAGEDLTKGTFVKVSGTFSAGDISTIQTTNTEQVNAAGFASAGDAKVVEAIADDTLPCFPVNKLERQPEDADSDAITAGEGVIYYVGGQYETDQYTSVSGTGGAPGQFLKVGADGKLVEEDSPYVRTTKSVAVVERKTEGITDGTVKDRLWFRLLDNF